MEELMKSKAGLEWGVHAGVLETLLNNTRKQAESALKSLDKFRSDPQRYKPQLKNVTEMLNTLRGVSRRGLQHVERLEKALADDVGAATAGATMNTRQEKDIIRTLVKAGHETLAKTFARSRGYGVKGKGRRVRAQTFDPRKAVVYFDLDQTIGDTEGGDEMAALKDLQKILKVRKIDNEGHDRYGALVCKIQDVHSPKDVEKLFKIINRAKGGGDDVIYLDDFQAQNFRLLPEGVNGPQIPTEDIDEFLEDVA